MTLFAILGTHKELSTAEIEAVLGGAVEARGEVAFFETDRTPEELQERFGGVQKVGTVLDSATGENLEQRLFEILREEPGERKMLVGISVYGNHQPFHGRDGERLGLSLKRRLKETGRGARLVTSRRATLSSADTRKNQLLSKGVELCLFVGNEEVTIGRVLAVQDIDDWARRDMARPARDARRGMLPPKLARMMVNLSGVSPAGKTLLDPFCGSGTVLMEAGLVGFEHVVGGDISGRAIDDTRKNLAWLREEGYRVAQSALYVGAATQVASKIKKESVDAIVTEPFLGEPRQGTERIEDIQQEVQALTALYSESFEALAPTLKPGASIVVSLPAHVVGQTIVPIDVKAVFDSSVWNIKRPPLLYRHEGQHVGRHVVVVSRDPRR